MAARIAGLAFITGIAPSELLMTDFDILGEMFRLAEERARRSADQAQVAQ